jgi:hypothetical protein
VKRLRAQDKFALNFYRWAQAEFAREIAEEFPVIRRIQHPMPLEFLTKMQTLAQSARQLLASALLKRAHSRAVQLSGEVISAEEAQLLESWYRPVVISTGIGRGTERKASLNRQSFRKLLRHELDTIPGRRTPILEPGELRYCCSVGIVDVETSIMTGSKGYDLCYVHNVLIGQQVYLAQFTSVLCWLGVFGQTMWSNLSDADAPRAAKMVTELCSRFIAAIPALIDGMTFGLSHEELECLWSELASVEDYGALWQLAAFPSDSIPFLAQRLLASIERNTELRPLGEVGRRALAESEGRAAFWAGREPPGFFDIRRRADPLLAALTEWGARTELRRCALAVVVLEMIGNDVAKKLLHELATGPTGTLLKEQALLSMSNLQRRK